MTFSIISAGDPVIASVVMQNWRHVNYGNALIPVDSNGVAADGTISLGTADAHWGDTYIGDGTNVTLFVDVSTGRVGIGTDSPNYRLEVSENAAQYAGYFYNASVDGYGLGVKVNNTDSDKYVLDAQNSTGTALFRVMNHGKVGIGTDSPGALLHSLATTEQLRLGYDASNYVSHTVSSSGNITVTPSGGEYEVDGYMKSSRVGFSVDSSLTISSGEITLSGVGAIDVAVETGSTDDLDTINGGSDNEIIILRADDDAETVVVKHYTGNIRLNGGADFSLDSTIDNIVLIKTGSVWCEISRSNNA